MFVRHALDGKTPQPCSCAACRESGQPATEFPSAEEGVAHELAALAARRNTWGNLAPEQRPLAAHVDAQHDETRELVQEEGEATRASLGAVQRDVQALQATLRQQQASHGVPSGAKGWVDKYALVSAGAGEPGEFYLPEGESAPVKVPQECAPPGNSLFDRVLVEKKRAWRALLLPELAERDLGQAALGGLYVATRPHGLCVAIPVRRAAAQPPQGRRRFEARRWPQWPCSGRAPRAQGDAA